MSWFSDTLQKYPQTDKIIVLGIDPGETTGICVFKGSILLDARQLKTKTPAAGAQTIVTYIDEYLAAKEPNKEMHIVMEDYRVYSWRAKTHVWQSLHTPRLIGALEYICYTKQIPLHKQSAQLGKGFCTDNKLKEWLYWQPNKPHANDAIRHACHYLLFNVAMPT